MIFYSKNCWKKKIMITIIPNFLSAPQPKSFVLSDFSKIAASVFHKASVKLQRKPNLSNHRGKFQQYYVNHNALLVVRISVPLP